MSFYGKSMKLLIDTNVILDVLADREPFAEESAAIWKYCETGKYEGYISTLTFANLIYIMRKQLKHNDISRCLASLRLIFRFASLSEKDLVRAVALRWDDYEDAIQYATAERISADCIVTRNSGDFRKGSIRTVTPYEFRRYVLDCEYAEYEAYNEYEDYEP